MQNNDSQPAPAFFVVFRGHKPGIYTSQAEALAQADEYNNAKVEIFRSLSAAQQAFVNYNPQPSQASGKRKFYVVWQGHTPGVYTNWNECKAQVENYPAARYKSFPTMEEAQKAYSDGWEQHVHPSGRTVAREARMLSAGPKPVSNAIAVDAACSGNPGKMEYRGVDLRTGKVIFHRGPFPQGTNNIGEFLAIVEGLATLKNNNDSTTVLYSDSENAISWIKQRKCKTKLAVNEKNEQLFSIVHRAEAWLQANTFSTEIRKWETKMWGEIPADFGRK